MNLQTQLAARHTTRTWLKAAVLGMSIAGALAPAALVAQESVAAQAASSQESSTAESRTALNEAQARLLDIATNAAQKYPLDPYAKNRARAQERVVMAAFELGDGARALRDNESIQNWRRGLGYTQHALQLVRAGADREQIQLWIDKAEAQAATVQEEQNPQKWRYDRILARIGQVLLEAGDDEGAKEYAVNLEPKEAGAVQTALAATVAAENVDEQLRALRAVVATGDFFRVRSALDSIAVLHDRFFEDEERRAELEALMRESYRELPISVRIEELLRLADQSAAHGASEDALRLVKDARALTDSTRWQPEQHVALMAAVSRSRQRAGEHERARLEADAALALYDEGEATIVNIDRAQALVWIAESYAVMGATDDAVTTYARALEASMVNPNSRPRTDDIVMICCSMALHDVPPSEALFARMDEIAELLWKAEAERLGR